MLKTVRNTDKELYEIIKEELARQRTGIEMIASENFVPAEILELQGSILTNKTAEGSPGKRYHAGCGVIDKSEILGIERAKKCFGAGHANIQPNGGSSANECVYTAVLKPGDTVLAMDLAMGGHLSHGHKINFSGRTYKFIHYGSKKDTETIDYDQVERLAKEHRPKLIVAGASSYPRFIDYERFSEIAKSVDAYFLVDMAHVAGLVAGGVHPNPVPHADFVTATTTKTLKGARGGFILCKKEYADKIDKAVFPGVQGGPILQTMAAKAFTFKIAMSDEFKEYAKQVIANAKTLANELENRGFRIVSGGTDNHIVLVDVRSKGLTGAELDQALEYAGITVNKNMIPFDPSSPMVTSGVRIGTAAMTSRGMKEAEMVEIAKLIGMVAQNIDNKAVLDDVKERAVAMSKKFPLYKDYIEE